MHFTHNHIDSCWHMMLRRTHIVCVKCFFGLQLAYTQIWKFGFTTFSCSSRTLTWEAKLWGLLHVLNQSVKSTTVAGQCLVVQTHWICWWMSRPPSFSMESRRSIRTMHNWYSMASWRNNRGIWIFIITTQPQLYANESLQRETPGF